LFVPLENDSGSNYNSITVNYNDEQLEDQPVSSSRRDITILEVNDAPVLKMGEVVLGGEETVTLTVAKENPVSLNLNTFDIDARTSDNSETPMAFRLAITRAEPQTEGDLVVFSVPPASGVRQVVTVQPGAGILGYIQFLGSQTQANEFLQGISFVFPEGEYDLEFVVHDKGFTGYCPPNLAVDKKVYISPDIRQTFGVEGTFPKDGDGKNITSRCNRVSKIAITFNAQSSASVIATVPAAVGASVAALAAIGAVIYAKLRKPEDLDAWQALDGAMGANTMSSGIHVQAGTAGKSGIYQGS